jgi:4-hydroxy-tetrahydrodipicolinate reductase
LPGYDVEVVETHHNQKADAPSGTATFLVKSVQAARAELEPLFGREGQVGRRKATEIGVHAVRGGGVVGDHTLHLIGEHDRIEITHRAINRDLFAQGALTAARWLARQEPGRYQLADVLDSSP